MQSYNFIRVNAVVLMNNLPAHGVIIKVLESSAYNISLPELKPATRDRACAAFPQQRYPQRWVKTCKKDQEHEMAKGTHGLKRINESVTRDCSAQTL